MPGARRRPPKPSAPRFGAPAELPLARTPVHRAELAADFLRRERELADDVTRARAAAEAESARTSAGKLCATPFGIDVVGITEAVALLGATVGGISARQRKAELEEVNEKLRQINISLRQQARAGVVYAPGTHDLCIGPGLAAGDSPLTWHCRAELRADRGGCDAYGA